MEENKKLLQKTFIVTIGGLSTKILSFFLLPIYTSELSTTEYGLVDYVTTISFFLLPFITLLLEEGLFRFLLDCKTEEETKKCISFITLVMGGSLIASSLLIFGIGEIFYIEGYLFLIAYNITQFILTYFSTILRGMKKIVQYAIYNLFSSMVTILSCIFFVVVLESGVEGVFFSRLISAVTVSIVFFIVNKMWTFYSFNDMNLKDNIEMIKYSLPMIPNKISWSLINLSDRLMLTHMNGLSEAGIYAVSHKFPTIVETLYGYFYISWKEMSATVDEDKRNEFYSQVFNALESLLLPASICLIAVMPAVYNILIDLDYFSGIWCVPFLIMASFYNNLAGFYGGIYTAIKKTKILGITTIIGAVINVVINLIFIPQYGIFACAFSTLIANLIVYIIRKIFSIEHAKIKTNKLMIVLDYIFLILVCVLFYFNNYIVWIVGIVISLVYFFVRNRNNFGSLIVNMKKEKM